MTLQGRVTEYAARFAVLTAVLLLAGAERAAANDFYAGTHEDARHTDLYVLEGTLTVNGERAEAGAWAHVAPGVPHTLDGAARYLVIHTP